jgi:hypothetical protein
LGQVGEGGVVGRKNAVRVPHLDCVRCHAPTSSKWKQSVLLCACPHVMMLRKGD